MDYTILLIVLIILFIVAGMVMFYRDRFITKSEENVIDVVDESNLEKP